MYLYFFIKDYFNFSSGAKVGSVFANINKGYFELIPILYPNYNLLFTYHGAVDPMFKQIANLTEENRELAALRDWLLPLLMSGEVRVSNRWVTSQIT